MTEIYEDFNFDHCVNRLLLNAARVHTQNRRKVSRWRGAPRTLAHSDKAS